MSGNRTTKSLTGDIEALRALCMIASGNKKERVFSLETRMITLKKLSEMELIRVIDTDAHEWIYEITPKGTAHVEVLLNTELPLN